MQNISALLSTFCGLTFEIELDPSITFSTAIERYENFPPILYRARWSAYNGDPHVVKVHLLDLGPMNTFQDFMQAGELTAAYPGLRSLKLQEFMAFDRQFPEISLRCVVLAHGLAGFRLQEELFGDIRYPKIHGWPEATRFGLGRHARFLVVEKNSLEIEIEKLLG
jgi:hypothetical protein